MTTDRFKVGDRVRIRNWETDEFPYDSRKMDIVEDMEKYQGMEATVTRLGAIVNYAGVHLDVDGGDWWWHEDLLELVKKDYVSDEDVKKVCQDFIEGKIGRNQFEAFFRGRV